VWICIAHHRPVTCWMCSYRENRNDLKVLMRIRYWDSSVLSESGKLFSMQWQHKRTNILGRLSAETGTYRWCYTGVDRADGQSNDVVSRRVCYPRLTARFRQQHARVRAEMLSGTRCLVKRSSLGAALSVAPCSSVRSVPPIFSKLERRRNF